MNIAPVKEIKLIRFLASGLHCPPLAVAFSYPFCLPECHIAPGKGVLRSPVDSATRRAYRPCGPHPRLEKTVGQSLTSDNDEIRFCLRSIRNYAPWVRTIWLVTDDQVPAAIDRQRAELDNIRIVDHREIFRGYEQLLPTFNSLAIETMLWRIKGLADRFLYFNDDMMLVGPVEPTDFFSSDGKVNLRGWWCNWIEQPDKRNSFHGSNKLLGAAMLGFTPEHFFSTHHVIYPLLRPAMEELFDRYESQVYRFALQLGAFLGALLPDGEPGRPGRKAGAAHRRHDAYGLHQCSGGGRGQGARCAAISLGGDRAGRALRNAASWDIGSVGR